MPGTFSDSNVRKSTSHHWSFTVITPASRAIRPAPCGGITFSTSARDVVRRFEARRPRRRVDIRQHVVRAVFDDALVIVVPRLHEQRLLRLHVFVAVENQHLAARLRALEIPRDLACALVRRRWTAIRRARNRDREHATVTHRLDLPPQRNGLRTCAPRMGKQSHAQHRCRGRDAFEKEVDAR